jgi:hypothetical protein
MGDRPEIDGAEAGETLQRTVLAVDLDRKGERRGAGVKLVERGWHTVRQLLREHGVMGAPAGRDRVIGDPMQQALRRQGRRASRVAEREVLLRVVRRPGPPEGTGRR